MSRVGHQHVDVEAGEALGDEPPDGPEADDADRRAAQLPRGGRDPARPAARAHGAIVLGHAPDRREHERDRVVRRSGGVGARRRADGHAGRRGRRDVDRVRSDTDARDHPQPVRGREHLGVERVRRDDGRVDAAEQHAELARIAVPELRREPHLARRGLEPRARRGVVRVVAGPGDEHARAGVGPLGQVHRVIESPDDLRRKGTVSSA
jgi:hypothetical protein